MSIFFIIKYAILNKKIKINIKEKTERYTLHTLLRAAVKTLLLREFANNPSVDSVNYVRYT